MAQVKCNIELFRASARDLTIVCYWGYTKLRTHLELYLNHLLTRLAWVSLLDFLSLHFITCKSNNSQLHEVFLRILYDNMLTSMVLWIISNSSPLSVPTSSPLWVGKSSHLCISRLYFPVSLILGLPMWLFFFFFDQWDVGESFQHTLPEESLMRVSNLCHEKNMPPTYSCWSGSQNEHTWSLSEPNLHNFECVNKCSLCAIGFLAALLHSNRWQIQDSPSIWSVNPYFPGYAQ